jgi:hypothetical protein
VAGGLDAHIGLPLPRGPAGSASGHAMGRPTAAMVPKTTITREGKVIKESS